MKLLEYAIVNEPNLAEIVEIEKLFGAYTI